MRLVTFIAFMLAMALIALPSTIMAGASQATLRTHSTIHITGNNGFTPLNGVIGGTGTAEDPFMIEGWDVSANGNIAVEVNNTTSYFVVRNNYIHSKVWGQWPLTPSKYEGIRLNNVTNAVIQGNRVSSSQGILVVGSKNITLDGNGIYSNANGLTITNSTDITVVENTIGDDAVNVNATNTLLFYHNNLVRTEVHYDDKGKNFWNSSYPAGGNFYSDYYTYFPNGGMDRCKGRYQNDCPSADGIGDLPYNITSESHDYYPLVKLDSLAPDVLSPRWPYPTQMNATAVGPGSMTLIWPKARDESAVAEYLVYKGARLCGGDELIGTVSGDTTTYTVTGLSPGNSYVFKVEAGDSAGNLSCLGPSLQVSTQSLLQAYWFLIPIPAGGVGAAIAVPTLLRKNRFRKFVRTGALIGLVFGVALIFYYLVYPCGPPCWVPAP